MQVNPLQYKLSLSVVTPKVVIEGVNFNIAYKVKNISNIAFPSGRVTVQISWSSLDQWVNQPIEIEKSLQPNEEFIETRYSQEPLMSGYTWFHVVGADASDGNAVIVNNLGGAQMWPYLQIASGQFFKQPLHAVRARTHEEIFNQQALMVAVGSLVVLVAFQIVDWVLRIYYHV
jgi:hypothetical protein